MTPYMSCLWETVVSEFCLSVYMWSVQCIMGIIHHRTYPCDIDNAALFSIV